MRSFTEDQQPACRVAEVDIEVVGHAEVGHGVEPDRARVKVDVVLGAGFLTEGFAHVCEFDMQWLQQRRVSAGDVLECIGELVVAVPLSFAQPIDESVDCVGQVCTRPLEFREHGVADVLERVGGQGVRQQRAERFRIAGGSAQRIEPDIVTHVHLQYDATRHRSRAGARWQERSRAGILGE